MAKTRIVMKRRHQVKIILSQVESNAGELKKRDKNLFSGILSRIVHLECQGTVAAFLQTKGVFAL